MRKKQRSGQIRLSAKDIGYSFTSSDTWLSNGHWAIRKARVSNAALFSSQSVFEAWANRSISFFNELPEEKLTKIATVGSVAFKVTTLTTSVGHKSIARLVLADNAHAWLNDDFLLKFGIQVGTTLYGTDSEKAIADAPVPSDATLVLMPMRVDDTTITKHMRDYLKTGTAKAA